MRWSFGKKRQMVIGALIKGAIGPVARSPDNPITPLQEFGELISPLESRAAVLSSN